MRRILSFIAATTLLLSATGALAAAGTATDVVRNTASQVLQRIKAEKELLNQHPEKVYDLVNELVIPHFDFTSMSKWVLGKNWRDATDDQRLQFTDEFRTLLVRTYAKALLEYSDQEIKYLDEMSSTNSNLVVVKTEITQSGSNPIPINYRMHVSGGDWKVIDVAVDGVSLVSTYRGEFASHIRKNGIGNLIVRLAERNSQSLQP
ncbi:MAG: ABC transporter substrate-binding protein [Gammaproteobacteria bacterium]|nr:ABC transporter substrate-binding protein [Gammaproteobacteria bacterium]